jgi:predicted Zn-dependent protease
LIELGRVDEAEPLVEGFETQLYRDALKGRIAQERGDAKRALELYGRASIEWPQNYGLRVLAARAAFEVGDIERAKSDLIEATRTRGRMAGSSRRRCLRNSSAAPRGRPGPGRPCPSP